MDMPTLGEQIRALRKKRGMTQEQLAEKLGTTKAAISRYEKDQRQPKISQIKKIATALDASTDETLLLFTGTEEMYLSEIDGEGNVVERTEFSELTCGMRRALADIVISQHDKEDGKLKEDVDKLLFTFCQLNPVLRDFIITEAEETLAEQQKSEARFQKFREKRMKQIAKDGE